MELQEDVNRRLARFTVISLLMLMGSMGALHYLASSMRRQRPTADSQAK